MHKKEKTKTCHVHKQSTSVNCKIIDCSDFGPCKDFERDKSGFYVLIKVNFELIKIELAVCNKDHEVVAIFRGNKSQDIYHSLFKYEKNNKIIWFKNKSHMAYIGKELKKAELALVLGNNAYFQE